MNFMSHIGLHKVAAALAAIALLSAQQVVPSRQTSGDAYQQHLARVRPLLPARSALPPLLDLSQSDGKETAANHAWENRFTGSMGVREHLDPGIGEPAGPGSISTTTNEWATPIWALPAHSCDAVVIATPAASSAHLSYNRRFVYSTFLLDVLKVLKGSKRGIKEGERLTGAQLGGTIRFPSGHVETFLMVEEGFMEPGKQYLLFMWKSIPSDSTYVVAEPYLIQNGLVFPIRTVADVSAYEKGMPVKDFEAKVRALIAKNIDSN